MPRIERSPLAKADAVGIWRYIAADNVAAADNVIDAIEARLQQLAQFPESGELVAFIRDDVRRVTVGSYVIFYYALDDGIAVARILHGAQRAEDHL